MIILILKKINAVISSIVNRVISNIEQSKLKQEFYLDARSKDFKSLSINEQSIYRTNRFSDDIVRDHYRNPLDILNFVNVQPGMQVIDLLGGGGYYTELFSHIVGENGKVYLQNNSLFLRFSIKEMENRLNNNRLANVIRLDSEYDNMQLPSNTDIIFMGISFHDFFVQRKDNIKPATPEKLYHQLRTALKPNGLIVLIDHSAKTNSDLTDTPLHRIDEEWVKTSLQTNGFQFIESLDVLKNQKDDLNLDIWNKKVKNKTDRFIHKYKLANY